MKISIVTGFQWHARELGDAFESLGHDVVYISTLKFASKGKRVPLRILMSLGERIPFLRLIVRPTFSLISLFKARESDLVVVWSSFGYFFTPKFTKMPVILIRGNFHIDTQFKLLEIHGGLNYRVSHILEKHDYANATRITVPTENIALDKTWGELAKKLVVAPYGFKASQGKKPRSLEFPLEVVFAGALSYRKGFDRLVDFFGEPWPDINFTAIGQKEFARQKLPNWWRYLGEVTHERALAEIANSHILILLSREEGMARVGQEALAAGLPVLATPESGLHAWLSQGAGIEISSHPTLDEVVHSIKEIASNYRHYSERAVQVSSSWTWEDHANVLLGALVHEL